MDREVIKEAPTVAEAIDLALDELGVQQDAVSYEVIDEPGKKLFGMGGERAAKVRVWIKEDYLREIEQAKQIARGMVEESGAEIVGDVASEQTETPELSEEELDRVADQAVGVLQEILPAFGITASIEEYEGDEGEIILDIVGGDCAALIGRHGRTLDALQVIVSAITNRALGFRYPVVVDVEGYKQRRRDKLEEVAHRAAERAARHGAPVKLRPMTAYERRLVHMALRDDRRVTTHSEGEEPYRQVVVLPK